MPWKITMQMQTTTNLLGQCTKSEKLSSRLTADLLAVANDRITMDFNRSETTQTVAIDISKAFELLGSVR